MDVWLTASACVGLSGLPLTRTAIEKYLLKSVDKKYIRRQPDKKWQFNLLGLPALTQMSYLKNQREAFQLTPTKTVEPLNYNPEQLWAKLEKTNRKELDKARWRCEVVLAVENLIAIGAPTRKALKIAALVYQCNMATMQRWYYRTRSYQACDYLPALLTHRSRL